MLSIRPVLAMAMCTQGGVTWRCHPVPEIIRSAFQLNSRHGSECPKVAQQAVGTLLPELSVCVYGGLGAKPP